MLKTALRGSQSHARCGQSPVFVSQDNRTGDTNTVLAVPGSYQSQRTCQKFPQTANCKHRLLVPSTKSQGLCPLTWHQKNGEKNRSKPLKSLKNSKMRVYLRTYKLRLEKSGHWSLVTGGVVVLPPGASPSSFLFFKPPKTPFFAFPPNFLHPFLPAVLNCHLSHYFSDVVSEK